MPESNLAYSLNKRRIPTDCFVVGWDFCIFEKHPENTD